jgi:uncharacterized repeat protein (TIGR02543 family)
MKDVPNVGTRREGHTVQQFLSSERKFRVTCIGFAFCLSAVIASPAQTLTTLLSFDGANGANPDYVSLVQGSDGNLYGTTLNGGEYAGGTVFKITLTGELTTLYSFCVQTGCPDGELPQAGLVQGIDGNFYGTTEHGGAPANAGTVFKITPTGTISTLYRFCTQGGTCADGAEPLAALVQATDGNFYGTTARGGDQGAGTVFQITPTGTLTRLYSFCPQGGACPDGQFPDAGLVQGTDGNFYGTTQRGGSNSVGEVFKITPSGTLTTLYSFCAQNYCTDGEGPYAGLVQGTDGNFYGTTQGGGSNNAGEVFKITPSGTLTRLYSLCSLNGCVDGANPYAGLVQATDGNFYGTTTEGGTNGNGTVFKVTPAGALTPLYSFCTQSGCVDGAQPFGGLVQATDGNFYGTTYNWGGNNLGTVFSLVPDYVLAVSVTGSGTVTSTDGFINCPSMCYRSYPNNTPVTLNATPASGWTFTGWSGACSGTGPCNVSMTQDLSVTATFSQQDYLLTVSTSGSGTVTSTDGGINCPSTCGNSYPVNTPVTLHAAPAPGWSFAGWSGACTGPGPCNVTMTQDQSVIATFTPLPNNYTLTVSISGSGTVTSSPSGINCPGTCSYTYASNTQVTLNESSGQDGTFSGWSGGSCSGTGSCIVTMTQNLSVTATFTGQSDMVMHSFGTRNDGQNPFGSLVVDSVGNFYGTTSTVGLYGKGTVFKLSTDREETVLYNFSNGNGDGQNPLGNLIFDSAGNLYGTTSAGGSYGNGTVFELSTNGTETVLYNFGNGADGQNPHAGLVFDSSGNLYGTTLNGGVFGGGTAFELSPNGSGGWTETFLYSFGTVGNDGLNPNSGLVFDNSGNLFGTTVNGGANGGGTVFELLFNTLNPRCCREILVYSFGSGSDGRNPYAGLVSDSSGNLYGTTAIGGDNNLGTAFELSSSGGGWTETFLYPFGNGADGQNPYAGLIFDNSGNLYGTTASGGLYSGGTAFELLPSSSANPRCCREILVYSFGSGSDARNPHAGLVFDSSGNLHGTTVNGGVNDSGTVFGITPLPSPVQFVAVTPCRLVDTRQTGGAIQGGGSRDFPIQQEGGCNIPATAAAYSLNVTVVPQGQLGYLTIWPTGEGRPVVSTLNSADGRVKANAAIVPAGTSGDVSVFVTDTTNVILDIDGYFAPVSDSTLAFYPLPPCRVADTRYSTYPPGLGPPSLTGGRPRAFPILSATSCNIPPTGVAAYSLNFTVVPHGTLGYLTVWPTGETQPTVSTLNDVLGRVIANAAIVVAGSSGEISAYATDNTDLIIDIDGYFAPAGSGGLSLYAVAPCRVIDTRHVGNGQPFSGILTPPVDVVGSSCGPPATAQAYVFNATVIPPGSLGYLTLWPDLENQPVVSTLNAADGSITNNMAIVPSTNGKVDAYASGITQLILDISSYFAP